MKQQIKCDVVVIGGGPAGMMAAARASARGRQVILLEKNHELGKKLSISGGGRCNITNNKPVVREMLSQYKDSGKFLFSTFMQHGVKESISWFVERNLELVEENEGRLFPYTFKAESVRELLVKELKQTEVQVVTSTAVQKILHNKTTKQFTVETNKAVYVAESCVVATGGTSRPETGSTGEGFQWLEALGHSIVPNNMALVPLVLDVPWVAKLAGVTLPDVRITIYANSKKHTAHVGKILFTHVGVTGPTILNISKQVGELLEDGTVELRVDLLPKLDAGSLKDVFQNFLLEGQNKKLKNIITELIPTSLAEVVLEVAELDGEMLGNSLTKGSKVRLLGLLKALPLAVKALLGPEKAVVSAGGVKLEEINFKTMESRIVPGLYLVGDVLNINRPSGGYSLQLCWSSGFVAGSNA